MKEEVSIPEPVEEPEPEPVDEPIAGAPIVSDEDRVVRPSEVASEQAELEDDEPEPYKEIEETPVPEEMRFESEEADVPESEELDYEEGKQVVADILEKVKAAEARSSVEDDTAPSESDLEPPPEPLEELDEPLVEIEVEEPIIVEEPEPETGFISIEEPSDVASPSASSEDASIDDEKVRTLETDINTYNIELVQLRSEFDTLRTHLDEEVERYHTVAEVKRTRAESIERDLSLAKKEHSDARKEYKNTDDRRKKELSKAEKRIREVEKRIKKAEESKNKRVQELEKERRKREEEN